jgi:inward rectifier potassium channel
MSAQAEQAPKDNLGFDNKAERNRKRTINRDGSFNVRRRNFFYREFHLYRWAITCKWRTYWLVVLIIYISANFLFASMYYFIGPEYIVGIDGDKSSQFWQCYFFSLQTFTTVGYGGLHPKGLLTNSLAGFEAFLGLMTFALATGALYGRFSKPEARIKYSANALIAPFHDGKAFMCMVCNDMNSNLAEVTAKINFSWVEMDENNKPLRQFEALKLEYEKVNMLALNWIIVHPIDQDSPLYGMTEQDFIEKDVEFFVLISAYDDTFAQTVHSRNSYVGEEIICNAKFRKPFFVDDDGYTVLDVKNLGEYDLIKA